MGTTDMDTPTLTTATNMPTSMGTNMAMDTDTMVRIANYVRDMNVLASPASPLHVAMVRLRQCQGQRVRLSFADLCLRLRLSLQGAPTWQLEFSMYR